LYIIQVDVLLLNAKLDLCISSKLMSVVPLLDAKLDPS
jgi:hypothetical protein